MRENPSRAIARDSDHGAGWRSADWGLRSVTALILVVLLSTLVMIVYHDRFWAPADEGKFAHVGEQSAG